MVLFFQLIQCLKIVNLENLNIKNLDTRNVYSVYHIFYGINKTINIIYNARITGNKLMNEIKNVIG